MPSYIKQCSYYGWNVSLPCVINFEEVNRDRKTIFILKLLRAHHLFRILIVQDSYSLTFYYNPTELASKMAQPGGSFFKNIFLQTRILLTPEFYLQHGSLARNIMTLNTDMGRRSKSQELLKTLFIFLSETIA